MHLHVATNLISEENKESFYHRFPIASRRSDHNRKMKPKSSPQSLDMSE
jgi:hypothetical protein